MAVKTGTPKWAKEAFVTNLRSGNVNKAKSVEIMTNNLLQEPPQELRNLKGPALTRRMGEMIAEVFNAEYPDMKMDGTYAKAYIDYLISAGRVKL